MDENKDFLTSENENESNINSDADTTINESTQETPASVFGDEIAETMPEFEAEAVSVDENTAASVAVKKKRFIQLPIIISVVILVAVALGFFVFKMFFNTSIVGTWAVINTATSDEATTVPDETVKTRYKFDSDGTASIHLGTMKMVGTYSIAEKDGKRTVEISIPQALEGNFEYDVTGNEFTGRTLELTETYYKQSIKLASTALSVPEMKPEADFKPNDKLTGKWTFSDSYYKMTYDFRSDGTVSINQSDIIYADGVYSYTDKQIKIKYFTTKEANMELNYELKDDYILIDGYKYYKGDGSSPDES